MIIERIFQEQRNTWNAYFKRQKEADELEEEEEEPMSTSMISIGSGSKSPRKSVSNTDQKAVIKVGLLEQQIVELKEKHDEEIEESKAEIESLRKTTVQHTCENIKIQSELRTLDMTVSMKDDAMKRLREEIELLNEKNARIMQTMETEAKSSSKITEEYVNLRDENVKLQIALESSKRRRAMCEDEVKRMKAEDEYRDRQESSHNLILDTMQQLQQQMSEKNLEENKRIRNELEQVRAQNESQKNKIDEIQKDRVELKTSLENQINTVNKELENEIKKNEAVSGELTRVKQRQLLDFNSKDGQSTSTRPTSMINELELKQLNDEIRALKSEKTKLETQKDEFKQISLDAEKRLNSTNEGKRGYFDCLHKHEFSFRKSKGFT